ncbi:MAG: response regulator, partial [bacterium]|nr:response regulator [bacterium]
MKKHILLVEYCSDTLETIKALLHHNIFDFTIAKTADVAKDLLRSINFDLLITESLLPKSHGFALSKFTSENSPGTKIIIISEQLEKFRYKEEAVNQHGADDFFEKPINCPEFKDAVFSLLKLKKDIETDENYDQGMTTTLNIHEILKKMEEEKNRNAPAAQKKNHHSRRSIRQHYRRSEERRKLRNRSGLTVSYNLPADVPLQGAS